MVGGLLFLRASETVRINQQLAVSPCPSFSSGLTASERPKVASKWEEPRKPPNDYPWCRETPMTDDVVLAPLPLCGVTGLFL